MGSLLKFEGEEMMDNYETSSSASSSSGHKLVPWLNWDEWLFVEYSLFSDSPESVASALKRILAWQSRGCLPVTVEVTASIIEIQQRDPHFRGQQANNGSLSEEMLAMLYCMAIIRLVNGLVEKTRKKTEVSIAVAADAIGIPRVLIDIRHEGSHRELPALKTVRSASVQALDWLKSYYWEPQKKAIPFQGQGTASIREEIKSKLLELACSLKVNQSPQCGSSLVKGKLKKQNTKNLKILVRLYSSFSSEVVSTLLELLLKAVNSFNLVEVPEDFQVVPIIHNSLDGWKLVITKLSNKGPELLMALLTAVLDRIETQEAIKYETGRQHHASSDYRRKSCQIEHLSSLFAWLVGSLKGLKLRRHKDSAAEEANVSKGILLGLLRKCLLVAPGNKQLMESALCLAQSTGNSFLMEKLKKLPSLGLPNTDVTQEIPPMTNLLGQQEESINQAAKKLELVKLRRMKNIVVETRAGDAENSKRWVVSRSWNPCPIGMLPHTLGSSGRHPVLEHHDGHGKVPELTEPKENRTSSPCCGKREASCEIQLIDNPSVKKRRETMEGCESDAVDELPTMENIKGHLMIGGVWKRVGEEDLLAIESGLRKWFDRI